MAQVTREADKRQGARVVRVEVRIGELSGVEADLFVVAFEQLREGTLCAEAELEVRRVSARWRCESCERDVATGGPLACARCGGPLALAAGAELMLDRIELEVAGV